MASDGEKQKQQLEQKLGETVNRMKQLEHQKRQLEIEIRRAAITASQLNEMPDDTVMYKSVGRAYFYQSKGAILEEMETSVKGKGVEISSMGKVRENLMGSQQELIRELTELS